MAGAAALRRGRASAARRLAAVTLLGFASGLPLALTGQAMQAWLAHDGVDLATIGLLSLVGLPYTFKFLWAPLMDRFEPPGLGRRRGWLVLTQLALAGALLALSGTAPAHGAAFAALALAVAFCSASQDVAFDAYRTDVLPPTERGMGASLQTLGYRLAMIVSGGLAFVWTDALHGGGWSWPQVYRLMAVLMLCAMPVSALVAPRVLPAAAEPPAHGTSSARRDLLGFVAVLAAAGVGVLFTARVAQPLAHRALAALWPVASPLLPKWADLLGLFAGLACTLPLAAWAARAARFDTLRRGLGSFFAQPGAAGFLALVVLYKLGDAFGASLMTPFLLQGLHFAQAEVGVVNKVIGLWLTILGALAGGLLMVRLGLWRSLLLFGVLQLLGNLAFRWLAVHGAGTLPGLTIPAFDWGFVKLAAPTPVDGGLLLVIAVDNLVSGMGTAAFVAFLMALCNHRFTATQYALLSAFASVGRVWVGPLAGVFAEAFGWPTFFVLAAVLALPALGLLVALRGRIEALDETC